jgi:hypothetical protein
MYLTNPEMNEMQKLINKNYRIGIYQFFPVFIIS